MTSTQAYPNTAKPSTSRDEPLGKLIELHDFAVAKAIHQREFALSMSPLLGCDYLFIRHRGPHHLLSQEQIANSIQELLEIFESSPRQSQIVSLDEVDEKQLKFTRYDFIWEENRVQNVLSTAITHSEQIEFMQMIYDCSSTC